MIRAVVDTNVLVSGDAHLLEIKYYHGVQIVTPRQFLGLLKASTATG